MHPSVQLQHYLQYSGYGSALSVHQYRWMDEEVVVHILLSHKKGGSNMDGPRDCHTKWSEAEKVSYCLYVQSKNDTDQLIYKTNSLSDLENRLIVTEVEIWVVGINQGVGINIYAQYSMDFPGGSDDKASAYNVGDLDSIPGSGRSPGEGNGNPLQYSCLENPMDGETW